MPQGLGLDSDSGSRLILEMSQDDGRSQPAQSSRVSHRTLRLASARHNGCASGRMRRLSNQ